MTDNAYPVRLDGHLDDDVSRWKWLVKWLLAIPHLVVLTFLWVAVLVLTFVAGVAILVTGRYPRRIFTFNVGVFRWTWRVSFYALTPAGTDRYPPFSLASDPDFPADFDVDYPERLSRGLVLVKWWLLALPQLLVIGLLSGGWGLHGGGLVALLSLVGVVTLAFTGRYPEQVFDLVLGFERWVYRVMAYCALMRDEYPPFRLDSGGTDPGHFAPLPVPEPAPTAPAGR